MYVGENGAWKRGVEAASHEMGGCHKKRVSQTDETTKQWWEHSLRNSKNDIVTNIGRKKYGKR